MDQKCEGQKLSLIFIVRGGLGPRALVGALGLVSCYVRQVDLMIIGLSLFVADPTP
jgi:hypothetical protein